MESQDDRSVEDALRDYLRMRVEKDPNASMIPNYLCHHCRSAVEASKILGPEKLELSDGQKVQEEFSHVGDIEELLRSASAGCHMCTFFSSSLASFKRSLSSFGLHPESKLTLSIECSAWGLSQQEKPPQFRDIRLYGIRAGLDRENKELVASQPVSNYIVDLPAEQVERWSIKGRARSSLWTGSEATFALVKDWLNHCFQNHSKCSALRSYAKAVPSRLLEIGDLAKDGSFHVRLVDTQTGNNTLNGCETLGRCDSANDRDGTQTLQYVTLSHRWPPNPIKKLTCENLKLFKMSIVWADLSNTFQDAIKTTQRLGIRYIWIDTFCIIQDSVEDWQKESAIMGDIYQGSVCTIACLDGGRLGEGCFRFRNPLHSYRCVLNKGFIMHSPGTSQIKDWGTNPLGELQTRGWVIQERVLSPRTIYFGPSQIMWECNEANATEAFSIDELGFYGLCTYPNPKLSFPLLDGTPSWDENNNDSAQLESFERYWKDLLIRYTDCDLTERSDKLVALHGIVRKIEENCGLRSIAGLWQQLLPGALLWYTPLSARHQYHPQSPSSKQFLAPSWSWASTDAQVVSHLSQLNTDSVISKGGLRWRMEVKSIEADALPNGQVHSGHLVICAPIRKIKPSMLQDYGPLHDQQPYSPFNERPLRLSSEERRFKYWNPDFSDVQDRDLYAVLAAQQDRLQEDGEFRFSRCNLGIVVRAQGSGLFERVGYFEEHFWKTDKWPLFSVYEQGSVETLTVI